MEKLRKLAMTGRAAEAGDLAAEIELHVSEASEHGEIPGTPATAGPFAA